MERRTDRDNETPLQIELSLKQRDGQAGETADRPTWRPTDRGDRQTDSFALDRQRDAQRLGDRQKDLPVDQASAYTDRETKIQGDGQTDLPAVRTEPKTDRRTGRRDIQTREIDRQGRQTDKQTCLQFELKTDKRTRKRSRQIRDTDRQGRQTDKGDRQIGETDRQTDRVACSSNCA